MGGLTFRFGFSLVFDSTPLKRHSTKYFVLKLVYALTPLQCNGSDSQPLKSGPLGRSADGPGPMAGGPPVLRAGGSLGAPGVLQRHRRRLGGSRPLAAAEAFSIECGPVASLAQWSLSVYPPWGLCGSVLDVKALHTQTTKAIASY